MPKKNISKTKKTNSGKARKQQKRSTAKAKTTKSQSLGLKDWLRSIKSGDTARFIVGLVLIALALFLAISFISFIKIFRPAVTPYYPL